MGKMSFVSLSLLLSDPTTNEFHIQIEFQDKRSKYEQNIIQFFTLLLKGKRIEINEETINEMKEELKKISESNKELEYYNTLIYSYLSLITEIDNEELKRQFYKLLFSTPRKNLAQEHDITKEEIEEKLKIFEHIEKVFLLIEKISKQNRKNIFSQEEIKNFIEEYLEEEYPTFIRQISSKFNEIDEKIILNMNSILLNDILNSNQLKIKDEDTLLKQLLNRRSYIIQNQQQEQENEDEITVFDDDDFFLEKVQFEYLSESGIRQFIDEVSIHQIGDELWKSICKRLVLPVNVKTKNERALQQKESISLLYDENNKFNGILKHLTDVSNGNIQTNKTIEIRSSKLCCGKFESIVDFGNQGGFAHIDGSPTPRWLQIDFRERRVQINSYLIKSSPEHNNYLKSWRVEISDGNHWEKIDEQDNATELNGKNQMKLFKVQMTKPFRLIRIITEKPNFSCDDGFSLGKLEFYGNIIENNKQ
ncbi:hypothetical protein M9Y10_012253 [Tritrichomonas musculus]|uniref:F5/8 type C domain-containing protein n=1 Tax=Tritrichomonas musculus TaxID=1915356 RepID=A0ABR2IC26_9EUKA